jgi:Stress responsive A/B Barrel Domain
MTPHFDLRIWLALAVLLPVCAVSRSAEKAEPRLAHTVFFTLKDHSTAERERFVASCRKYLADHEGVVSFAVGTIAEDVEEPSVSVRDFDVSLLVVFSNKAAERKYLEHPRHTQFVEENKPSFAKVRVFDSYLDGR